MKLAALVALLNLGYGCATAPRAPVPIVEETEEERREQSFLLAASYIETEILQETGKYKAEFTFPRGNGTATNGYLALRRESTRYGNAVQFLVQYNKDGALVERRAYTYLSKRPHQLLQATIDRRDEQYKARYENGRWTLMEVQLTAQRADHLPTDDIVEKIQRDFRDEVIDLVNAHIKRNKIYVEAAHERRVL